MSGGRDVTFLAHPGTRRRLAAEGVRVRHPDGAITATPVTVVTNDDLDQPFDIVVLAVRSSAVKEAAIEDVLPAIGPATQVLPIVNGMAHLAELTAAFTERHVLGGTARLATSLRPDGVIDEVRQLGIDLEIGRLDGHRTDIVAGVADELSVAGTTVTIADDIVAAMWNKFAFITATAVLTCLLGDVIGPIAAAPGGAEVAQQILAEVDTVAAAEGRPMTTDARKALRTMLTDPTSRFAPSMFRDLRAGRPVEAAVLTESPRSVRDEHLLATPLLDATLVALELLAAERAGSP